MKSFLLHYNVPIDFAFVYVTNMWTYNSVFYNTCFRV